MAVPVTDQQTAQTECSVCRYHDGVAATLLARPNSGGPRNQSALLDLKMRREGHAKVCLFPRGGRNG
jgi:hypothetical protein